MKNATVQHAIVVKFQPKVTFCYKASLKVMNLGFAIHCAFSFLFFGTFVWLKERVEISRRGAFMAPWVAAIASEGNRSISNWPVSMIMATLTALKCAAVEAKCPFHCGRSWFLVCDLVADMEPQKWWSLSIPLQFSIQLHLFFIWRNKTVHPFPPVKTWHPRRLCGKYQSLEWLYCDYLNTPYRGPAEKKKTPDTRVMAP